ncbi:hypothetical protein DNTS_012339 [Danionella cerebrum]|uniref:DUF4592 domain-containing protein n=1 Tax=Danionella cerebrum TaxID=2873325 RepID=A0A553NKH2_9TELE|nr:hypothetical protein DNTS_012339 [Danionella translucida]
MEANSGEINKNGEEHAGRKKSRFKQLKTRLFGRLKKKESEGLFKQSQSASDITAPQRRRDGYDSEEEFTYPQSLSFRALSHDSIFFTDQTQSSEPTRVLSQENVHSKIKVLQLKLQQQNLHLGPPPMMIPGKRKEDSGTTSEDDGLPCSPPESCFSEQDMDRAVYKFSEPQKHLSSLSLAGTGSEEEEQGDTDQSQRPCSPLSKLSSQPVTSFTSDMATSPGVDFTHPVSLMPTLDNSAARHRMLVKPRNQRASTRGNRRSMVPLSSSHRSESGTDLNFILSEEDDEETLMSSEIAESFLTLVQKELEDEEKTKNCVKSENMKKSEDSFQPERKVELNPLLLQSLTLASGSTSPSELPESSQRLTESLRIDLIVQRENTVDFQVKTNENLVIKEGIREEAPFRLQPVPLPRNKMPKLDLKHPLSPKGVSESGSVQFSIASAKNRSKITSETVAEQKEGQLKIKTSSANANWELQKETNVKTGKLEGAKEQRNAFGVRLRTTSLSLKHRSTVSGLDDETKRHSLESNTVLGGSEERAGKTETLRNKPHLPKKTDALGLEDKLAAQDHSRPSLQYEADVCKEVSEPSWISLLREKTRVYQPIMSRLYTNQSPTDTSARVQPLKPAILPKTALKPHKTINGSLESLQRTATKSTTQEKQDKIKNSDGAKRGVVVPNITEALPIADIAGSLPPDFSQPSWMELAKRKSLAWSDKSLE